jgi:hypothetical protein
MEPKMRMLLALLAAPFLTTFAPMSLFRSPVPPAVATLSVMPIPLHETDPARKTVGRLSYLGGWVLRSNDGRFGGISAMHVEAGEVIALSDAGSLFRFPLPERREPGLTILPLPEGPGSPEVKGDRDTEAMAVHKKRVWIAFEGRNQIWRYRRSDWTSDASAAPSGMRKWSSNSGAEAMLRLADGRFIVFSEGLGRSNGSSDALLFDGDPALEGTAAQPLSYVAPTGFRITDAAALPDGRLLLLNRGVGLADGLSAKLTLVDAASIAAGRALRGQEIAHLQAPLTVDNMEALSVTQENKRTIIWLASDDNFIPLQRTLLLKFELRE